MKQLNRDQLDGLAKFCFDLAKAGLLLALFPTTDLPTKPIVSSLKIISGLIAGIAFTYFALVLLKAKEEVKS